ARSHGEDVAQNSTDASGCALKRLDEGRVIVRFDFEGAGPAIADVDDAGIFSGSLHYALAPRGKPLQVHARRLVRAVLAPHHTENTQLGQRGLATKQVEDFLVLVRRNAVIADNFGRNGSGGSILRHARGTVAVPLIFSCFSLISNANCRYKGAILSRSSK